MKTARQLVVQTVEQGVAVVVISRRSRYAVLLTALLAPSAAFSAVLPEERTDLIYHSYEGDGLTVDGPSVLVRKNFDDKVSAWGRYYEDFVSGASIDVRAAATSFEEKRTEYSLGADYLYDKTTLNLSYTNSDSGDYVSDSLAFGASHDFFGDLTTVALSFGVSDETVYDVTDDAFEEPVETLSYTLSVSQILTKSIIVGLTAQTIASEGYLNNPYRDTRFVDSNGPGYSPESEFYPDTRNSDAIAIRYNQYLPYRASIRGEYRYFSDNWGVTSDTYRIDYIHPVDEEWTLHFNLRYYDQTGADFYSDLFAFSRLAAIDVDKEFRARDKELSTMTALSFGIGASYVFPEHWVPFMDKSSANLFFDRVDYDYSDFRDITARNADGSFLEVGTEPLFGFSANVFRLFVSFWY